MTVENPVAATLFLIPFPPIKDTSFLISSIKVGSEMDNRIDHETGFKISAVLIFEK